MLRLKIARWLKMGLPGFRMPSQPGDSNISMSLDVLWSPAAGVLCSILFREWMPGFSNRLIRLIPSMAKDCGEPLSGGLNRISGRIDPRLAGFQQTVPVIA